MGIVSLFDECAQIFIDEVGNANPMLPIIVVVSDSRGEITVITRKGILCCVVIENDWRP